MECRHVRYCRLLGVPELDGRNVTVHGIRVDAWLERARLVVELDSAHHVRRREMEADRRRDRALARRDMDTLRLVWHALDAGDAQAIRDTLQRLERRGALDA